MAFKGRYTANREAERKVEQDLKIVKEIIIRRLKPVSILLFGGFGRGEGSFQKVNGKILPLNDYDMYAITRDDVSEKEIEETGIECSEAIGRGGGEFVSNYLDTYDRNKYFHVDLRYIKYSELGKQRRINRTYELKHGSLVIYGEDVRKKINDITVPLSESFRYLINPAGHLILTMDSRRMKGSFKQDEKFYVIHHIIKAYLAIASSMIISSGSFKATYSSTNDEFQRLFRKKFPLLAGRVDEATRMKKEARKEFSPAEIKKRWINAREDLHFCLSYISKKHLKIEARDIISLTQKLYRKLPFFYFKDYLPFGFLNSIAFPCQYYLNLLYFKRTGYAKVLLDWKDVGLRIFMAAYLMLYAYENKAVRKEAAEYIRTFAPVKSENWEDLRKSLLYGFDKYYSQKII